MVVSLLIVWKLLTVYPIELDNQQLRSSPKKEGNQMYTFKIFLGTEKWEPLKYKKVKLNYYEISNMGRIRNNKGDIIKQHISNSGYLIYGFSGDDGKKHTYTIHRIVAFHFVIGRDVDNGVDYVDHKNSDKTNNYYYNLEWTTNKENMQRFVNQNLEMLKSRTSNQFRKFDDYIIKKICEKLENGEKPSEIYNDINFSGKYNKSLHDLIDSVKHKKRWKSVSDNYNIQEKKYYEILEEEIVRKICGCLENTQSPKIILKILGFPVSEKKRYMKLICDIKYKKSWKKISDEYDFKPMRLTRAIYDEELIHQICVYLQKGYPTVEILKILDIGDHNKINIRDLIYDIKKRRVWNNVSKNYIW